MIKVIEKDGKINSPIKGRMVKIGGQTHKNILKIYDVVDGMWKKKDKAIITKKKEKSGNIINPITGRYIECNGVTFNKVLKFYDYKDGILVKKNVINQIVYMPLFYDKSNVVFKEFKMIVLKSPDSFEKIGTGQWRGLKGWLMDMCIKHIVCITHYKDSDMEYIVYTGMDVKIVGKDGCNVGIYSINLGEPEKRVIGKKYIILEDIDSYKETKL